MSVPATTSVIDTRSGNFSYLDKKTAPSLHRNGKVLTRRDQDGSDAKWTGVNLVPTAMPVHDARSLNGTDRRSLARNGFELLTQAFDGSPIDFLDNDQVVSSYYPHCADIVREATGASVVMAFDHNIRSAAGKQSKQRIQGGQQVQGPAHVVHGDYTLTSAPERLRKLAEPPGSNDTWRSASAPNDSLLDPEQVQRALSGGRFQIINLWRNIADTPVARNPMALCDGRTVQLNDLVVFEIHYADRIGENYFARHADAHQWYCYPAMTHEEALLITQWDSAGELAQSNGAQPDSVSSDLPCTMCFHSAFEDPTTPDNAPDRWSIEVRCAVLHD